MREGFFKQPNGKTMEEVLKALETRGLSTKGKEDRIMSFLARRVDKGALKKSEDSNGCVCWTE
jgi:hypothetical protein